MGIVINARRKNPLRMDPTRTVTLRRALTGEIRRRFRELSAAIVDWLIEQDQLGLALNARDFAFVTDPGKLRAFSRWLTAQVSKGILSVPEGQDPNKPWLAPFIESAYRKGATKAFIAAKKKDLIQEGNPALAQSTERVLRQAFTRGEATSKMELLATRSFEQLKGITAQMSGKMNRVMAQGIADGRGPREVARELSAEVGLATGRAETLARTEIIYAHAEGQLDEFEALGQEDVSVDAEWSTAGDDRVCPQCEEMEGKVMSIDEARGQIPLHPNCRCSWIPA